jgi:hypothetical protein
MKKKNKKAKKRVPYEEEFDRAEVHDELLALTAIFGDDLKVEEGNEAFKLHVVPHPGEAETNYVSIKLEIRSEMYMAISASLLFNIVQEKDETYLPARFLPRQTR